MYKWVRTSAKRSKTANHQNPHPHLSTVCPKSLVSFSWHHTSFLICSVLWHPVAERMSANVPCWLLLRQNLFHLFLEDLCRYFPSHCQPYCSKNRFFLVILFPDDRINSRQIRRNGLLRHLYWQCTCTYVNLGVFLTCSMSWWHKLSLRNLSRNMRSLTCRSHPSCNIRTAIRAIFLASSIPLKNTCHGFDRTTIWRWSLALISSPRSN